MTKPALGNTGLKHAHTRPPTHHPGSSPILAGLSGSPKLAAVTKSQRMLKEGAGLTRGCRVQGPGRQLWAGGSVDPWPGSWSWLQEAATVQEVNSSRKPPRQTLCSPSSPSCTEQNCPHPNPRSSQPSQCHRRIGLRWRAAAGGPLEAGGLGDLPSSGVGSDWPQVSASLALGIRKRRGP